MVGETLANTAIQEAMKDAPALDKDTYDSTYQQLIANNPNLKDNDPAVVRALVSAVANAKLVGNEKFLSTIIPDIIQKTKTGEIDLKLKDAQAKIEAELKKAEQTYALQLETSKAKNEADLKVNSVGMSTYEQGAGSWGAIAAFFVAVIDSFQQGSLDPMRAFIADARAPKNAEIHARKLEGIDNAYEKQNPQLGAEKIEQQAANAMKSKDVIGAMTSEAGAEEKTSKNQHIIVQNSSEISSPKSTTVAPSVKTHSKLGDMIMGPIEGIATAGPR